MDTLQNFGIDWTTLIFYTINFGILVVLLYKFAYKPVLTILEKRRDIIAKSLQEADDISRQKQSMQEEYKKILQDATKESQTIIQNASDQGKILIAQLTQEAQDQARKLIDEAKLEIEKERAETYDQLKGHIERLLAQTLSHTLKESLSEDEQNRILQKSVEEIQNNL